MQLDSKYGQKSWSLDVAAAKIQYARPGNRPAGSLKKTPEQVAMICPGLAQVQTPLTSQAELCRKSDSRMGVGSGEASD